jgi:tetratricopeptide (TPR) repeat protein
VHRYEELEKIYYKKMFLKIIVILLFFFVTFVGIYYFYKNGFHLNKSSQSIKTDKIENNQSKEENKTKFEQKTVEQKTVKENKIKTPKKRENAKKNKTINQEEKLTFVVPQISENEIKKEITTPEKTGNSSNKKTESETKIKKPLNNTSITVKPEIEIKEKKISLNELKQKFSMNPSYDLALMIAKEYYKQKNYKQAQIWAIKANNLDPQKVESWLLFADILLKENKKKKALEILKIYLDQYGEEERIRAKIRSIDE